eukprot:gene3863-13926_t
MDHTDEQEKAASSPSPASGRVGDLDSPVILPSGKAGSEFEPTSSGSSRDVGLEEAEQPGWYSPIRVLLLFCCIMTLTWLDQGSFASNGVQGGWPSKGNPKGDPGLIMELGVSPFEDGVLAAMYALGLIMASIVFASLAGTLNELRLVGIGLFIWMAGCLATGGTQTYAGMVVARMMVGAGEASVATLTFPFIDDCAPSESKTLWFGCLALCQPVGVALGFMVGGLVAEEIGWRNVFLIQAGMAIPLMAFCLLAPAVSLKRWVDEPALGLPQEMQHHEHVEIEYEEQRNNVGIPEGERDYTPFRLAVPLEDSAEVDRKISQRQRRSNQSAPSWFWRRWRRLAILLSHRAWWFNNLGAVPVEFALQAMSYYGPRAGKAMFDKDGTEMDLTLGALAVGTGVIGALSGGLALDRCGSSVKNGFGLMVLLAATAFTLLTTAFAVTSLPYEGFITLISFGLLAIMALNPMADALSMWTVPAEQRPMSQALVTISQRALGDLPATPIIGAVQGALNNWRHSMLIATCIMALSIVLFFFGWLFSKHHLLPDDFQPLVHYHQGTSGTKTHTSEHAVRGEEYETGSPKSEKARPSKVEGVY